MEQTVQADLIIANASIPQIVDTLIPSMKQTPFAKKINQSTIATSLFTLYIIFEESISEFTKGHYSTFIYDPNLTSIKDFAGIEQSKDYQRKGIVFVDYSAIDSGLPSDGNYLGVICGGR